MEKVKTIINTPWFRAALAGVVGASLLFKGEIFYAGIAFGIGVREFFFAFKK